MEGGGDNHELQLNLGLSLNGRFGVDPSRKDLKRSSSISDLPDAGSSTDNGRGRDARAVEFNSHAPLMRAASLPPDTEEWRRRKALHMAQCVEARRKRLEKMRNVRAANDINNINNNNGNNNIIINNNNGNKVHGNVNGGENGVEVIKSGITMPAPRRAFGYLKIKGSSANVNRNNHLMGGAIQNAQSRQFVIREPVQRPSGQLVIREPIQRPAGQLFIREPVPRPASQLAIREPVPRPASQLAIREPVPRPAGQLVLREPVPGPAINPPERDESQQHNNALYSMPMVSTNGPNNTTIEGFLYKYNMRDAIKIVCVCHGDFLTPAEFVKHAIGRDVENPLQHILVTPFRIE